MNYLPLEEMKTGYAYLVDARNFDIAIWTGTQFAGLRFKFNESFIDYEEHWDVGSPHGTCKPLKELS